MCASCGCGVPDAAHGDDRHITLEDLERAAEAVSITLQQVLHNIAQTIAEANGATHPAASIDAATPITR